jgi:hypothetical protein
MYILPVSPHKPPTDYYKTVAEAVFGQTFSKNNSNSTEKLLHMKSLSHLKRREESKPS